MKAHKLLSTCVQHIDINEKILRQVIDEYQDIHPELVRECLGKVYQDAEIDVEYGGATNYEDWGYQEYQRSTKHPEGLIHRTLKGDYVRSKSKVVIANTIYIENGYRPYEDILFTFDDMNGTIDAKNLDILITNFCK